MKIQKKIKEECIYTNGKRQVLLRTFDVNGYIKEIPVAWGISSDLGTMILALDSENNIHYCREYRDWPDKFILNLSVWGHEPELSFEENALKEIKEELWVYSCDIEYLWWWIVGNYETSGVKYFIAKNCEFWENELEEWEVMTIEKSTIQEFEDKITLWEIECPLTVHCYTLAKLQGKI